MVAIVPGKLRIGDSFRLRNTTNARKYIVKGLVLKMCKENGFKYILPENINQILVPVEPDKIMILPPDKEVYLT